MSNFSDVLEFEIVVEVELLYRYSVNFITHAESVVLDPVFIEFIFIYVSARSY